MSEDTFVFGGMEHPVKPPKGRAGRKATAWLMKQFGSGDEADTSAVMDLMDDEQFNDYLPTLLGLEPEFIEEEGDLGEMFGAIMSVISAVTAKMSSEEVDAAAKNS